MLDCVRPGMREFELAAELYCVMKQLGAEDNFLLLSASQHNLAVRAAGGRVLDVGDIILSEITPCYQGQFAQLCRTTVIGEPTPLMREKYALLQEAMRAGQAAAVPGAARARRDRARWTIASAPPATATTAGRPTCACAATGSASPRTCRATSRSRARRRLEEGMMFVMHPNQYIPETGYLMCGEPVVITPHGAKALSARVAELDSVAA